MEKCMKDDYSRGLEEGAKWGREEAWKEMKKLGPYKEGHARAMEFWQNNIDTTFDRG
jgi:hypothetical protein